MKNVSIDVVEPFISEEFSKKQKPSKPIISIHTREPRDTAKIIKTFYLKYPQYRWITFRDMRGIKLSDFSKFLKDSYLAVWVDSESGFGTFPIECMVTGTPVIGKVPNLKPSWLTEENGVWTYQFNEIVDIIANFTQNWLEDNLNPLLYTEMEKTISNYTDSTKFNEEVIKTFSDMINTRLENFEDQLSKFITIE